MSKAMFSTRLTFNYFQVQLKSSTPYLLSFFKKLENYSWNCLELIRKQIIPLVGHLIALDWFPPWYMKENGAVFSAGVILSTVRYWQESVLKLVMNVPWLLSPKRLSQKNWGDPRRKHDKTSHSTDTIQWRTNVTVLFVWMCQLVGKESNN